MSEQTLNIMRTSIGRAMMSLALSALVGSPSAVFAAAPGVSISQVPMTITIPAHPQIMLAVANSESMDGTLSGAIMTGAGLYPLMQNSSSPLDFTIPAGFTPPVNDGNGVIAPYTVAGSGGLWLDNSPSRLNVAKAGIMSVLTNYIPYADFGLMEYSLPGLSAYATSVYLMSPNVSLTNPTGSFLFTSVQTPIAGVEYVNNPCYKYTTAALSHITNGSWAYNDCASWATFYASQNIVNQQWMGIGASSDDPQVNDVLYGLAINCTDYTTAAELYVPSPPNPFTAYSLADYNNNPGNIYEGYNYTTNGCLTGVSPTNAGYVPYSPQVMYLARGFGYYTDQQAGNRTAGQVMVPIGPANSAGQYPTPASVQAVHNTFWPFLAAETDSAGTGELKAAGVQSPIAGLIAAANHFYTTVNPASTDACSTSRYLVLITDGLPTLDSHGNAWPPLGSTSGNNWGVTAGFDPVTGALIYSETNDAAIKDTVTQLTLLANNNVKTYIIAVGAGVDPSVNPEAAQTMTAMAIAGGTGQYFPATTPQAVSDALQLIIDTILTTEQSTSSAAVNSTGLNTNSVVYQSQFNSSDVYQDWTGNVFAFPISTSTGIVDTLPPGLWSAQAQLDNQFPSERVIATWDPNALAGTPFEWNGSASATGISTATTLGQELGTFVADSSGSDVLTYLRGSSALEQRNGGPMRNRTHKLGDIVNSNPLYIGAPSGSSQLSSYTTFVNMKANRTPVLYVGANDGMLHAFNANNGNELFAYIPAGVYANLINLVSPYYNARHQFFVNGSPQASDVQFANNSWHTVLVSAEQAGGNSVFAIDVTDPDTLTNEMQLANSVLWDFTDPDMGLTYSTPSNAQTSDTTASWQVFVGNGYNSRFQKPFLYALNAQTGAIITKIDLCAAVPTACNLAASNGLSTVIAVNGGGQVSGAVTLVYGGDLQGNLWRINVSNPNPLNWTVSVSFQARDSFGNPQPITTTPAATLNPRYPQVLGTMVFVGTGELLGIPDLSNFQTESIYGIYDPPNGYTTPINRFTASMVQQSIADASLDGTTVRIVTGNAVSIPTNSGWYMDLDAITGGTFTASASGLVTISGGTVTGQGERVITDPRIESGGGVVLTTYEPTDSLCTAGGSSFLMVLNYASGGSFPSPQFSVNGSVTINATDSLPVSNGSGSMLLVNPVGLSLGSVYAAAPTIQNANFATASKIKLITESTGAIQTVAEKGSSKNRTAWWEIRQ